MTTLIQQHKPFIWKTHGVSLRKQEPTLITQGPLSAVWCAGNGAVLQFAGVDFDPSYSAN